MIRMGSAVCLILVLLTSGCAATSEDRQNDLRNRFPQWDPSVLQKVSDRHVEVGMTEEMVRAGMGKPFSTTQVGDEKVWEYSRFRMDNSGINLPRSSFYVHFQNGKVTATQGDISAAF